MIPFGDELQNAINQVIFSSDDYPEIGISAAVLVPGYEIWTGVCGNSEPGIPITEEMVFDIGSIQKNFQAALVLKLVEDGKLSLDDQISDYLPPLTNVFGNIQIRQLLNHTSGVYNVFEHPDFPWIRTDVDYSKKWNLEEVFNSFVLEPYGMPGFVQHYSSTNYLLLTAILEGVIGTTIPDEIENLFLNPLNLNRTFTSMGAPPLTDQLAAHPWVDIDLDGELDDLYGIPLTWKVSLTHPVIFSTPKDLVQWINALYYEGTVLNSTSMAEMLTFPETALSDPEGAKFGLGVVDYSNLLGMKVIGHGGSSLGYSAAALYLPEFGFSFVWMINTGESPEELADFLMSKTWYELSEVLINNQDTLP